MKSEIEFNPNWTIQDLSQQELYILTYLYAKDKDLLCYNIKYIAKAFEEEPDSSVLHYIYKSKQLNYALTKIKLGYEEYAKQNLIGSYIWKQKEK